MCACGECCSLLCDATERDAWDNGECGSSVEASVGTLVGRLSENKTRDRGRPILISRHRCDPPPTKPFLFLFLFLHIAFAHGVVYCVATASTSAPRQSMRARVCCVYARTQNKHTSRPQASKTKKGGKRLLVRVEHVKYVDDQNFTSTLGGR